MCTLCDSTNNNTIIITADMLQTDWNELDYRVDVCRITKRAYIQHLLDVVGSGCGALRCRVPAL